MIGLNRDRMMAFYAWAVGRLGRDVVTIDRRERPDAPYLTRIYLFKLRPWRPADSTRWGQALQQTFALTAVLSASRVGRAAAELLCRVWGAFRLGPPEIAAFVHCFSDSDPDQLHDHPWRWCLRVILTGGYYEETFDGIVWHAPGLGSIDIWLGRRFHRVILRKEDIGQYNVWTLFVHGKRCQSWGFLYTDEAGHVRRTDESKKRSRDGDHTLNAKA